MAPNITTVPPPNPVQLKLFIDPSAPSWLTDRYDTAIAEHNHSIMRTAPYADSGFDLFIPTNCELEGGQTVFIDHKIRCAMYYNDRPTAFFLAPRSSVSKTSLQLCNSVGIIDSGYRGNLIGAFRNTNPVGSPFFILREIRLLQICHPSLEAIQVERVFSDSDLATTSRGHGGFGSTGV